MDSGDIAKVSLAGLTVIALVVKLADILITKHITLQVDRLIEAGCANNANAQERHEGTQKSLKRVARALKRLKRKKCAKKQHQDGPTRHPDDVPKGKTRPAKAK